MPFSFCANTPLYMEVSVLLWFVSRHRKQPRMSFQSSKTCVCLNMMSQHTNHSFTLFNKVQERPVILLSKHQQQFDRVSFESSASGKLELPGLLLLSPSQGSPPLASGDWKRDLDQLIFYCNIVLYCDSFIQISSQKPFWRRLANAIFFGIRKKTKKTAPIRCF